MLRTIFIGSSISESSRDGDDGAVPGGYGYEEGPPGYSHTNGNGENLGEVGVLSTYSSLLFPSKLKPNNIYITDQ